MKEIKFEDLLRETIAKYNSFNLHLSKCNSVFSTQLLLDNYRLTSKSCDFGTWYFTQKSQLNLPSLKDIEAPYIKIYELYKLVEIQFYSKLSNKDKLKRSLRFVKSEPNPIIKTIEELQINCQLLIHKLKKVEAEYSLQKNRPNQYTRRYQTKTDSNNELVLATVEEANSILAYDSKKVQLQLDTPQLNTMLPNKLEQNINPDSNPRMNLIETIENQLNYHSNKIDNNFYQSTELYKENDSNESEWESIMAMKNMMDNI